MSGPIPKSLLLQNLSAHGTGHGYPLILGVNTVEGPKNVIGRRADVRLTEAETVSVLATLMANPKWFGIVGAMTVELSKLMEVAEKGDSFAKLMGTDKLLIISRLERAGNKALEGSENER